MKTGHPHRHAVVTPGLSARIEVPLGRAGTGGRRRRQAAACPCRSSVRAGRGSSRANCLENASLDIPRRTSRCGPNGGQHSQYYPSSWTPRRSSKLSPMAQVRFDPRPTRWSGVSLASACWCWLLWSLPSSSPTWSRRDVEDGDCPRRGPGGRAGAHRLVAAAGERPLAGIGPVTNEGVVRLPRGASTSRKRCHRGERPSDDPAAAAVVSDASGDASDEPAAGHMPEADSPTQGSQAVSRKTPSRGNVASRSSTRTLAIGSGAASLPTAE